MHDAALDMRMNTSSPKSAYDVVNSYSCEELMRIFYDYGEEKSGQSVLRNLFVKNVKQSLLKQHLNLLKS